MIIMYSDYNPDHASADLEEDDLDMLRAALFLAGQNSAWLHQYEKLADQSANAYESQLGVMSPRGVQDYQDAIKAAEPYQKALNLMLGEAGITLINALMKPPKKDHHYFIQTKIYNCNEDYRLFACINRQITDLEAKTYTNNITGYGASRPGSPFTTGAAAMSSLRRKRK